MNTIAQILQAWADNVPESAALPDDLKMKLVQATVEVINQSPAENKPPKIPLSERSEAA